jgi:hypothetical protein
MLWQCVSADKAEVTVGQTVLAAALKVLPKGLMRHLLIDRGYLDGDWLSRLYRRHDVQVTIGVRENMQSYNDLIGLTRLPQTPWEAVSPPDNHREPAPERAVTYIETVTSWDRCTVPLAGCVIRDTYPDQVSYQVLVMTLPRQPSVPVTAKDIYRGRAQRWTLEEVFMALTRYWHFDALYPYRLGVGRAIVHLSLLAFTLLGLYRQESDEAETLSSLNAGPPPLPLPERELAVYAGPYFALLRTSQIMDLILMHAEIWTNRRSGIFKALSRFEGDP